MQNLMVPNPQAIELIQSVLHLEGLTQIAAVTLFAAAFLLSGFLLNPRGPEHLSELCRFLQICALLSVVSHLTLLLIHPQAQAAHLVTFGLAGIISLATVSLDLDRSRIPAVTFLASALCWALIILTPFVFPAPLQIPEVKELNLLGQVHIATAIAGEGLFAFAFVNSAVYLFVHRRLKKHRLDGTLRLPSLESLDRIVARTTSLGFALISISLITGVGLLFQGYSLNSVGLTKIMWAFGVWLWYVLASYGRARWGWRGRKGAYVATVGAGFLSLALFGTFWS